MLTPGKDEFLRATAGRGTMPVFRDLPADVETPLSAYWKLAHDEPCSFLLESVTGGEQLARYSVLGVRPRLVLRTRGTEVRRISPQGESREQLRPGEDPLRVLAREMPPDPVPVPDMPKFVGGAVGLLSYDLVRFFERLPEHALDDLGADDMAMMLCDAVVVFDHARNRLRVIVLAPGTPEGYDAAVAEIERVAARLRRPLPDLPMQRFAPSAMVANVTKPEYETAVERVIEYIGAGDCIQAVLSQRLSGECPAHPVAIYRALRSLNPSPYMYLYRFGDFDVVGASPEILVGLYGGEARVRPIAGTRPRGAHSAEDERLADELLADEKERAEHVMLVDLGRNDLGRVCEYGSVHVSELMVIERYSHVMHIVSDVTGTLAAGRDAFDLIRATFPAGTVSGAPKVRAMEIVEELEPTRRGPYAGAVGYVSAFGDMDMAIAIRTIFLQGGIAHVQAGAGIVWDSVPEREWQECLNKARAPVRALEIALQGGEVG